MKWIQMKWTQMNIINFIFKIYYNVIIKLFTPLL
jgi:hypothetical protein